MANSRNNIIHFLLLIVVTGMFIWSAIKPKEGYLIWSLEVVPAIIGVLVVVIIYKRFQFTTLSYVIISILAILMSIGGHYSYNEEPFFEWLKDTYNLKRNYYDRLGHFFKGFIVIIIREVLMRKTPLTKPVWVNCISVSITLAIAALFEIIEWLGVIIFQHGGKIVKNYLGAQGDPWDTQWDMFLTFVGSLCALILFAKLHDRLCRDLR